MNPSPSDPLIETGIFSELFGFVVTDPASLERFHKKSVVGFDLLSLYTQTDEGNLVSKAGAAIPIVGVPAGYYSVVFRASAVPTLLQGKPLARSTGWVLNVISGLVVVCGIGYLSRWDPKHPSLRHVALSAGWYEVEVQLGLSINDDDYVLEIIVSPSGIKPLFSADVTKNLLEEKDGL